MEIYQLNIRDRRIGITYSVQIEVEGDVLRGLRAEKVGADSYVVPTEDMGVNVLRDVSDFVRFDIGEPILNETERSE